MSSPFAEPPPAPQRNRLSIAHLMLWTLGSAIALSFYRELTLTNAPADDPRALLFQILGLIYCLPAGACIASVLLLVAKVVRGDRSFPVLPGHWLLIVEGISALLSWVGRAAVLFFFQNEAPNVSLWSISQVPNCLFTAVAYGVALRHISADRRLWKATFWVLLLEHAGAGWMFAAVAVSFRTGYLTRPWDWMWFYNVQSTCCPSVLIILLPLASLTDRHRPRADFLHWAGIAAMLFTSLLNLTVRWLIHRL